MANKTSIIFPGYHCGFLNKSGLTNRDFELLFSIIQFSGGILAKFSLEYNKTVACHSASHRHPYVSDNSRLPKSKKVSLAFSECALISFDCCFDTPTAMEGKQANKHPPTPQNTNTVLTRNSLKQCCK